MFRFAKPLGLGISILIAAALATGCSSSSPTQEEWDTSSANHQPVFESVLDEPINGLIQSSSGGSVTIDVKWLGPKDGFLRFDVAMNTHSVDLDSYDLGELSLLRDDVGQEHRPLSWQSGPGGHHRRGILVFPLLDSLGNRTARHLQLVIHDVAGVEERVLNWDLE